MSPLNGTRYRRAVTATTSTFSTFGLEKEETIGAYVRHILDCYAVLANLPSLYPSLVTTQAFSRLVSICTQVPDESIVLGILADHEIAQITPHLQKICSIGEFNLECYWAEKIASHDQRLDCLPTFSYSKVTLANFIYYDNYVDLTKMELSAISFAYPSQPPSKFAFLGCGPLPMTSLCILEQLEKEKNHKSIFILNIDLDPNAILMASKVSRQLGYSETSMGFLCDRAGGEQNDLKDFDVVYLAALVGSTSEEKREIFHAVLSRMRLGAVLVIRTAHALRSLLYPVVRASADLYSPCFELLMVVHPYNHVVNSVIIGRVGPPIALGV